MIMKTIKYTDYDGVERSESFYFNLSKAELVSMDFEVDGGFKRKIEKVIEAQNQRELIEIFKDIIFRSYGEKSADGRRFIKSKEISEAFTQTEAYSELFMELATDATAAEAFIRGIMPPEISNGALTELNAK